MEPIDRRRLTRITLPLRLCAHLMAREASLDQALVLGVHISSSGENGIQLNT
jgi:hypothetical protein